MTKEEKRERDRLKAAEYRRTYPERAKESYRKWRAALSPEKRKELRRRKSIKEWEKRRHEQDELAGRSRPGACEVCHHVPARGLHFDHSHSTGNFRGWLCYNCNMALGLLHDNPAVLRNLADYLEGKLRPDLSQDHTESRS